MIGTHLYTQKTSKYTVPQLWIFIYLPNYPIKTLCWNVFHELDYTYRGGGSLRLLLSLYAYRNKWAKIVLLFLALLLQVYVVPCHLKMRCVDFSNLWPPCKGLVVMFLWGTPVFTKYMILDITLLTHCFSQLPFPLLFENGFLSPLTTFDPEKQIIFDCSYHVPLHLWDKVKWFWMASSLFKITFGLSNNYFLCSPAKSVLQCEEACQTPAVKVKYKSSKLYIIQ